MYWRKLIVALVVGISIGQFSIAQAYFDFDKYEYVSGENNSVQLENNKNDKKILNQDEKEKKQESIQNDVNELNSIRYSKSGDKVRVVIDLNQETLYEVKQQDNGDILIDFSEPINQQYLNGITVGDDTVPFLEVYSDDKMSCIVIKVTDGSGYETGELKNPRRLYVDVQKDYEYSITKELEPGLTQISYYSKKSGLKQQAQLVDIDPKYFKFVPVLGGGNKLAKNTVSAMSDYVNAAAAENASYFGSGKELYGVTKIAGDLVSSMYLTRTAFGVLADGTPYIGDVSYSGIVQSKNGEIYVAGLNSTRSNNSVMLYNQYYGNSTGTDNTGIEYVVKDNKIVKINQGNSILRPGEIVVSATGEAKNTLMGLNVGDDLIIEQILNTPWDTATDILGVGPRLVRNGQIDVTSVEEQIGPDVTGARAPRTAVGILRSGHILFAVVDGRQGHSKGMMLDEFAQFLIGMDVIDAVNFDGGGSSELVIGGKIVNSPSDGMERPVATALTAVRR